MKPPDWSEPFEIMCDASDYAVGVVLGQRKDKQLHSIYYASRTLDAAQQRKRNYLLLIARLETIEDDSLGPHEHFQKSLAVSNVPWYADFVNYLAADIVPPDLDYHRKKKFFNDVRNFYWDEPPLFKRGKDGIFRRCIPEEEVKSIIEHCHSAPYGGHASTSKTYAKILQVGLFWPTMWRNVHACIVKYDRCQRTGNISRHDEMPLRNIQEVELFDVWGIDFMGPFPPSSLHPNVPDEERHETDEEYDRREQYPVPHVSPHHPSPSHTAPSSSSFAGYTPGFYITEEMA
ncbi:hypothetical protein KIW84_072729 [Lathyrus oleraceus]|uniref:Integrase zinc-binding domain-containing protein n=1 Tax=Pisum sativum TaxID=3888 RepID=A0A9D4VNW9_PEA|nr:hypothetical protein KIW84_072729 [Pisum sativum]